MHRYDLQHLAAAIAAALVVSVSGSAAAQGDEGNQPGVTDLTRATVESIEAKDIVDALAVPRGTRIEASAPPTVRLPVYFEFNSTDLKPDAVVLLEKVGAALSAEELETFHFSVEGHTDSVGPASYNDGLSSRRAQAVRTFLVGQGVPEPRLQTVGRGEAEPVADNATDEGRQRNRRVELINLGAQP